METKLNLYQDLFSLVLNISTNFSTNLEGMASFNKNMLESGIQWKLDINVCTF